MDANTRAKLWQQENKERASETDRQHYLKHRDSLLKAAAKYRETHGDALRAKARQRTLDAKLEVIAAYGGRCACCGESHFEFLSVDHINNDGCVERRAGRSHGYTLYRRLKKLGFPKDRYQLLCFNCNLAKGFFGYCPHEKEREAI